jgi:hypothetical protein
MPAVNLLAVALAAIAAFFVGFLWHGPLFGRTWMRLSGISEKEAKAAMEKGGMGKTMFLAFLQQLVTAFVMALFAYDLGVADAIDALLLAFWAWLGFVVTVHLNAVLWEKRAPALYLFNIAYQFVSFAVIALIVGLWR